MPHLFDALDYLSNNQLAIRANTALVARMEEAQVMISSGFLPKSVDKPEKVIVISDYADALQIPRIVALMGGINVIGGKPTASPQLLLAKANQMGQLENILITDDGECCTVQIKRKGRELHVETFSMDDARHIMTKEWENNVPRVIPLAEKANWKAQAKVMRRWRCVAAALRIVFPDVTMGLYTPEEMGANGLYDDESGDYVIDEPITITKPDQPAQSSADETPKPDAQQQGKPKPDNWWTNSTKNQKYIQGWLDAQVGVNLKGAIALLGDKRPEEFASGKDFCNAVVAAMAEKAPPAKPKTDTAKTKSKADFSVFPRQHFDKSEQEVLAAMGLDDCTAAADCFKDLQSWESEVLKTASAALWPIRVTTASFKSSASQKSMIKLESMYGPLMLYSRHTLVDQLKASMPAVENWSEWEAIYDDRSGWKTGKTFALLEPIWAYVKQNDDGSKLVLDHVSLVLLTPEHEQPVADGEDIPW